MATITSLNFHIFARYHGDNAFRRARNDIARLDNNLARMNNRMRATGSGMSILAAAAVNLAPAMAPIAVSALGIAGGIAAMGVAAGAAAGIFGIVAVAAAKNAKQMGAWGQHYTTAVKNAKTMWMQFVKASAPMVLRPLVTVLYAVSGAFMRLMPVVRATAPIFNQLANAFASWLRRSDGLQRFVNVIVRHGVPALTALVGAGRHMMTVLGHAFRVLAPLGNQLAWALLRGAAALARWAEGGGFSRFVAMVRKNAPQVKEFFRALWAALRQLSIAFIQLGPLALGMTTALLKLIAATPVPMLKAMVLAFGALKMIMLIAKFFVFLQIVFTIVKIAIIGLRIAWILLSMAFASTPIGFAITLIVALIAAIVFIALKTRWFQNLWGVIWRAIRTAVRAVWPGIQAVFKAVAWFFTKGIPAAGMFLWRIIRAVWRAIWSAIMVVWRVIRVVFNFYVWYYTKAIPAAARFLWGIIRGVWRAIMNVIAGAYRWIRDNVFGPIGRFFTRSIPNAARFLWGSIRGVWRAIMNVIAGVYRWLRDNVFGPIGRFFTRSIPNAARFLWGTIRGTWRAIMNVIAGVYRWVRDNVFNPIGRFFTRSIPNAARFLWGSIRGNWRAIMNVIAGVYRWIRDHVFGPIGRFFTKTIPGWANFVKDKVIRAFDILMRGVKKAWSFLKEIVRKPINIAIGIINGGIIGPINAVAKFIGIKLRIDKINRLAAGGRVDGLGGDTSDKIPAMLSAGEHVLTAREVRAMGGHRSVMNMRSQALNGRAAGMPSGDGAHFGGGGAVNPRAQLGGKKGGNIKAAKKAGKKSIIDVVGNLVAKLVRGSIGVVADPILDWGIRTIHKMVGKGSGWKVVTREGLSLPLKWIKDWIAQDDAANSFANGYIPWAKWKGGDGRKVSVRGKRMNIRTRAMLFHAEKLRKGRFGISQGSFSNSVGKSAGTHSGGGALDVTPGSNNYKGVGVLRASGFAAWARGRSEGMSPHIHAIAVGDPTASAQAKRQVRDFFAGKNGLAGGGPDNYNGGGGRAGRWRGLVMSVLKELGEGPANANNVLKAIMKESGGNPRAVNRWDSNARRGTPSGGLIQTIGPTFNRWAGKYRKYGMFHPRANIYAGIRYARARYGRGWSARMARPGGYAEGGPVLPMGSYDRGGFLPKGLSLAYNGTGKPEPVGHHMGGDVHFHGSVYVKSEREFRDMVIEAVADAKRKGRA